MAPLLLGACYSTGNGPDPPASSLYFPVGMAVSPGGKTLYLANSDFDLQYNSGTVIAVDLERVRSILQPLWSPDNAGASSCAAVGLGPNPNPTLQPGDCDALDLSKPPGGGAGLVRESVKIGAFATDMLLLCRTTADDPAAAAGSTGLGASAPTFGRSRCRGATADPGGARLFLPVRGDPSLTFFDIDDDRPGPGQDFKLECGQAANAGRCSDPYRAGINPNENSRGVTLPPEPLGIAVSDRADAIVITHQSNGAVSLFTGPMQAGDNTVLDGKPILQFVYGGVPPASAVVALPIPPSVLALPPPDPDQPVPLATYLEGFGVVYSGASQVDVYRFLIDQFAAPQRPFLSRSSARGFDVVPSGIDSRDIAIDASERSACENDCAAQASASGAASPACAAGCAQIPLGAYVTNRTPPSLLIGQVLHLADSTLSDESIAMYDAIALPAGPSRVAIGQIHDRRDPPGVRRPRVFAICFDARTIVVYDPVARRVDGQIRTGRGPHALAMDPVEAIGYVTHFTDSYVGLVDLDQLHADKFESIVATIGVPSAPRESK